MRTLYTMRCKRTGETLAVVVCDAHKLGMPLVASDGSVTATVADSDCRCEFCPRPRAAR